MNRRGRKSLALTLLLIPLLLINTGCDMPLFAEPTPTPTVTETPLPTNTDTPLPTETRTATPNLLATQQANFEISVRDMLTDLELPADSGEIGWYQTEKVKIRIEGPDWDYSPFAEDLIPSDFVVYTQMTWDTDSWPNCGIWFRAEDDWEWGDFYMLTFLRLSGLPAFDIEYYVDGILKSIITEQVRFSSFLDLEDGATNEIALSAIENEFKVFVNGIFEGRYYDYSNKLTEGRLAFMASQTAGDTTCSFDNTWVWVYK